MTEISPAPWDTNLHVLTTFLDQGIRYLKGYTYPVYQATYDMAVQYRWGREPYGTEIPGHDPNAPRVAAADGEPEPVTIHPDNVHTTTS